ncbi:MAG: ABC transporter substrate-binding protein [Actinomycetota bacterium]|nr:ABC transporter substrate-binding protein [Actinomycetota bacterium]
MRKALLAVAVFGLLGAACASSSTTSTPPAGGTASTAAECAASATFVTDGTLTIGTDNPAYPPYFQGGAENGSEWKINDPNTGKGFESAVAYEIADRMGFSNDQVAWTVVKFAQSYAPGPKSFDFDINQISYSAKRATAVDFSESYYDVNQALVVVKGTPIAAATSLTDLQQYTLAAPLGTTSYDLITNYIQPTKDPGVYQTLADSVAALNAGQVDGLVVDYPTALYLADPYVQEVKDSTVLAQFPNDAVEGGEYFGTVQGKDSPLTPCINLALQEMKDDGTLDTITDEWLSKKTNVGEVPTFSA